MNYSLRIADLPTTERPRERLLQIGAKHLGTAELLAILLRTGQGAGKLSAVGLETVPKENIKKRRDR